MKVVILAGGFGTRISEESHLRPKPMIEIGGMPLLWHIMRQYSYFGFNDFIICAGYRSYVIKEYFADYHLHRSDVTFDFSNNNKITIHSNIAEPWKVTIIDTGLNTMTGGRIKRVQKYIGDNPFMLTYGDAVSDININTLLDFHKSKGQIVTLTACRPEGRFGVLDIDDNNTVNAIAEKKKEDSRWVNAGFMVMEPAFFDMIEGDETALEKEPLEQAAALGQLNAYKHHGFWQCMDTMREKELLEKLWNSENTPWRLWDDR